jgi:tetratricopeptide (TPR) repeat protein
LAQPPQFGAKELLADAVSDVGPKHNEVNDAIRKFSLNDFDGALAHLNNAKAAAPEIPPPELLMAKLCLVGANQQIGRDVARGRAWIERTVIAHPGDPEPYTILGEVALNEGRVTDADVLYAQAQQLAEKFGENAKRKLNAQRRSLQGLAAVAIRRENWDRAKAMIDAWIKLDPDNPAAHSALAHVLFYQKNERAAYASYQKADSLLAITADRNSPPSPMAELNMAALYQRRDNDDKKTGDFINLAVSKNPKDFGVRLRAAQIAMNSNLLVIALEQSEAAVKMKEDDLTAKLFRGYVARLRGDATTAEDYFELAHLQSPSNFDASNNLALLLAESPDKAKQDRAFEFALMNAQRFPINGQNPVRFDALATLGWLQSKRPGGEAAAEDAFRQVNPLAMSPDSKYYYASVLMNDPNRLNILVVILQSAVESDQPFVNRAKATELLATLKSKMGSGSPRK